MATRQPIMWDAMRAHLPRNQWLPIDEIYRVIVEHVALQPDDKGPEAKGSKAPRWKRNVRNILQHRRQTGEIVWSGDEHYLLVGDAQASLVSAERERRLQIWRSLHKRSTEVTGATVRELGIYSGQAGIFADKKRTAALTGGSSAVAIGLLHTGTSYADDLTADGIVYHYPRTRRPGRADAHEIEATKWAGRLGLPLFVISVPQRGVSTREVRLGWIVEWSDAERIFLIQFDDSPHPVLPKEEDEASPFELHEAREPIFRLAKARPGQARFKFDVIQRYGTQCAVCEVSVPDVIDAAHILPKGRKGSDDPRNGLPLCATHHRAYDAWLFAFEPDRLAVVARAQGPSVHALGLSRASLAHLRKRPHHEALAWRWQRFQAVHGKVAAPATKRRQP